MDERKLIIDRPARLSDLRKRTEWSLTLIGWAIWFFLCRPLLLLTLWLLGVKQIYVHMVRLGGAIAVVEWLHWYSFVILAVSLAVLAWNRYNWFRFRGRDKRRRSADASLEEMAQCVSIPAETLPRLQQCREVTIRFSPNCRLDIRAGGGGAPAAVPPVSGRYDPARPVIPQQWSPTPTTPPPSAGPR